VRSAAIGTLAQMYSKVGEELLIVLPEQIPDLAERLEDDDIEVEREAKQLVKLIEGLSGEKLDRYFQMR
jgi:U3 small nucleolar RNA-associated protein 10